MSTQITYTTGELDSEITNEFEARLEAAREHGSPPLPHFIAGAEVVGGERFIHHDPSRTQDAASQAHEGGQEMVARALKAAREAQKGWRGTPVEERIGRLSRVGDAIGARRLEIAAVLSLETGKTRHEAIAEVQEGIDMISTYCGFAEESNGWTRPLRSLHDGERNQDVLRPYGTFGVVSPFNFPFALLLGMSTGAMITGNTVVVKPAEDAPWTAALFTDTLAAADLPPGVFNLVHGGPDTGAALVASNVDGIVFTGSAEVGRSIARGLQDGFFSRPALTEMGGKNPAIVCATADVEAAAEGVARAAFGMSGQKCSACSRAIVLEDVYDEFAERLTGWAERFRLGDPAERDAWLGPVINADGVERFRKAVAAAEASGRVTVGGGVPDLPGHFVEATVVVDLPIGHELTRQELFLPVVTVTSVSTFDEAMVEANATPYGLTAGIYTADLAERARFLDEIEAGVLFTNRRAGATTGSWPGSQAFCGWKSSGTTGKGGLGPWYLQQFMREQSRTVVD